MAGGVRSWRCHGVVEEQEEEEEEEEEKVGGWRGRGENFEGGRKNNTRSIKETQNGVVQIKCAGNQPLSPPHARARGRERKRGGGERERERAHNIRALFLQILAAQARGVR